MGEVETRLEKLCLDGINPSFTSQDLNIGRKYSRTQEGPSSNGMCCRMLNQKRKKTRIKTKKTRIRKTKIKMERTKTRKTKTRRTIRKTKRRNKSVGHCQRWSIANTKYSIFIVILR